MKTYLFFLVLGNFIHTIEFNSFFWGINSIVWMKFPKSKKDRYVFTCITCLANSQIRRTDPLSGTSIDEHWGPFSVQLDTKKNRLMKLQLQKTQEKKQRSFKNSLLPFFKNGSFPNDFLFSPSQGSISSESPLCFFGGWTGVFHSAGCQWSDIDSLLAPPLISFFWYWPLCAMSKKRLYQFFGVVILR